MSVAVKVPDYDAREFHTWRNSGRFDEFSTSRIQPNTVLASNRCEDKVSESVPIKIGRANLSHKLDRSQAQFASETSCTVSK